MPRYIIEVEEIVRQISQYYIEAPDAEAAQEMFEDGEVGPPHDVYITDVDECNILSIEEDEEENDA